MQSTKSLKTFTFNRLILLDLNPDLRSIDFGEVLRIIVGTAVMMLYKKDVTVAAGSLQFSADQRAVAETLIHAMTDIFA